MALDPNCVGKPIGPLTKEYDWKDVILYALGVGASFEELDYCYENRLKVIPSFSIAAVYEFLAQAGLSSQANLAGILHGEQDIIFHHPIPPAGKLITKGAITDLYDKGADKGAIVVASADTFHSDGRKLFTNIFKLFCRLDGGFGGSDAPSEPMAFPDRPPDFEQDDVPRPDQPLLYRLSGDIFQLHVDPAFAQASGFEKPIMHGLCTHGFACRAVIKHLFPGKPELMTRFCARFSRPLYPGVPIRTQIWKLKDGYALFRTLNTQTGEVALDRGIVEWVDEQTFQERSNAGWIRFDDRVAIVTGAGGGLGRVYAIELAKRGAKVVVNDFGGPRDGTGDASQAPADRVVDEIRAMGGQAVANYDSVATPQGGEALVRTALDTFGRVDVLINNAGILRDRSFTKMTSDEWDAVLAVHFDAAYHVTRPAFIKMREQGFGRIVLTTSAAGLYGNFGQTNYSAAKMGLVGFMNSLRLEGDKHNIRVNAVAPLAATRLTEDVLPPDLFQRLRPEFVAPLVVYLCSEQCPESGGIYNAGMGYFSRAAVVAGPMVPVGDSETPPTVEAVADSMGRITSLKGAAGSHDLAAALGEMLTAMSEPSAAEAHPTKGVSVAEVFNRIGEAFQPEKASRVEVIFQFNIEGPGGGAWNVAVKDNTCVSSSGTHPQPTTTIIMSDSDFLELVAGRLNAMKAYTSGKLKVQGDLMKSQLVEKLFKFRV
ncbi:MAG: SDR family NAD(P)-dependent oxidoreductase [Thermodesulfobacteriota bacterium]